MAATESTSRTHSWRDNLSPEASADLSASQRRLDLAPGHHLYRYGDQADTGYVIESGKIEITSTSQDGRRLLLANLTRGDCVGDLALVNSAIRINDAVAVGPTTVAALHRRDYERLCLKHPEISLAMSRMLGRRFQLLFSIIQDASLLPLYQRLGRHIVRLSVTQGERCADGTLLIRDCSQETLGDMVGAVRQSVGRELKKMADTGLIAIEFRSIRILQSQRMIAEFGQTLDYEPMMQELLEAMG